MKLYLPIQWIHNNPSISGAKAFKTMKLALAYTTMMKEVDKPFDFVHWTIATIELDQPEVKIINLAEYGDSRA